MKNVTISLDDATWARVRERAAGEGRSLSSVVRESLAGYGAPPGEIEHSASEERTTRRRPDTEQAPPEEFERLAREEREIIARLDARPIQFNGADRLSREELYDSDLRGERW